MGAEIARRTSALKLGELLLLDARREPVERLGRELSAAGKPVDLTDPAETTHLLRGCDVVMNAAPYTENLLVMETALRAGCDYVDLGGLFHTTRRQLELDPRFAAEGLLAILGMGKAPGITNLLAASARERIPAVTRVLLRSGRKILSEESEIGIPYAPRTLLDEFTLKPVIVEDGVLVEKEPLSRQTVVDHPDPIGPLLYVTTLHSELATLPAYLGVQLRSMEFQVALPNRTAVLLTELVRLGFADPKPVPGLTPSVSPRELTVRLLEQVPVGIGPERWITEVGVEGEKAGQAVRLVSRVSGNERQNGTAIAAVAALSLWARGRLRTTGVKSPERSVPADEFLEELTKTDLSLVLNEPVDAVA